MILNTKSLKKHYTLMRPHALAMIIVLVVSALALSGLSTLVSRTNTSVSVGCKQIVTKGGTIAKETFYRKQYGYPLWFVGNGSPNGVSWYSCYTLGEPVPASITQKSASTFQTIYLLIDFLIYLVISTVVLCVAICLYKKPTKTGKV